MTLSLLYPRMEALKRCSKLLAKRFAVRLSMAQEILCRASGLQGMNDLTDSIKSATGGDLRGASGESKDA